MLWRQQRTTLPVVKTLGLGLVLGLSLALVWLTTFAAAPGVVLQQDTPSASPSASPSPSLTPSPSASPTITATATLTSTATATGSPAASLTATVTTLPVASATTTSAFLPSASPVPSLNPILTPGESGPTATLIGPTPTLLPLPVVTYQFPQDKPNDELLIQAQPTAAQALPKGGNPFSLRIDFRRSWFLWVVLFLWTGLIAWFVIAQIITRRQ